MGAKEMLSAIAAKGLVGRPETCPKCGGKMITEIEIPSQDGTEASKMRVACLCECELEEREKTKREAEKKERMAAIEKNRKASLMDERFYDATFSRFKETADNARNLKLAKRYSDKFDLMLEKNQGLLFYGDVGTGKSFMAACIANKLLDDGYSVIMTSFVKILEAIQGNSAEEKRIINQLNSASLVIFDDLGAERSTDYALEKVYGIIDARYRKKLPMILTTNISLKEMTSESDIRYSRIYDRVFESCYQMLFTGKSWRKKASSERYAEMKRFLEED